MSNVITVAFGIILAEALLKLRDNLLVPWLTKQANKYEIEDIVQRCDLLALQVKDSGHRKVIQDAIKSTNDMERLLKMESRIVEIIKQQKETKVG